MSLIILLQLILVLAIIEVFLVNPSIATSENKIPANLQKSDTALRASNPLQAIIDYLRGLIINGEPVNNFCNTTIDNTTGSDNTFRNRT